MPTHTTINPATAVAKLKPSKLSDQLEGLGGDVDLTTLNLAVKGRASEWIREAVTDAQLTRTVKGASTVTLNVQDDDYAILSSGILGNDALTIDEHIGSVLGTQVRLGTFVDIEVDGLWFRLVGIDKEEPTVRSLKLTFEDREVALLRSYPRRALGQSLHRAFDPAMTRAQVMYALIAEVRELQVRVVFNVGPGSNLPQNTILTPSKVDTATKAVTHQPGFASFARVTVKGAKASAAQRANLEAVLAAGTAIPNLPRVLLVATVMVVTQESDAINLPFDIGSGSIGLFQQEKSQGWPATGDPTTDADAFYAAALTLYNEEPALDLALLCATVQKPRAFLDTGDTHMYGQWRTEAEQTVSYYLGLGDSATSGGPSDAAPATPITNLKGQFVQGSISIVGGRNIVVAETNWAMLQRLAAEVGWWCYCVSGTLYIENPELLFQARPVATFDEDEDYVNGIGFSVDTGKADATVTVLCDAARWSIPPGSVGAIKDMGPINGRWLVTEIARDLFHTQAEVTMQKPQRPLADPESATPVQASGVEEFQPGGTPRSGQTPPGVVSATRAAIVAAARKALADRGRYLYAQIRPMPTSLTESPLERIDCSAFVTLDFKAGLAKDPNHLGYNGEGDTATLYAHATKTSAPQPGDLAFYLPWDVPGKPHHVAVVSSVNGKTVNVIEMGTHGVSELDATRMGLTLIGYFTPDVLT